MKATFGVLISALLMIGLVATAAAQTSGSSPSQPEQKPATQTERGDAKKPDAAPANPSATNPPTVENKVQVNPPASGSEGSALPRAAAERTTIFGLSPTVAVVVAAALLVIVILSIVAMSRNRDGIEIDTRPRL